MRIAIFGGGGSKGAEVVGFMAKNKPQYDAYIGTSTGSFIAVMCACGKYKELKDAYTSIDNKTMYGRVAPYDKKGDLNKALIVWKGLAAIRQKREYLWDISQAIEELVKKHFTREDFKKLRSGEVEVLISAQGIDYKNDIIRYYSVHDKDMYYEKFVECLKASAAIPFLSRPVRVSGEQFIDGGISDPVPTTMISTKFKGYDADVYLMTSTRDDDKKLSVVDGLFDYLFRLIGIMRRSIEDDDLKKLKMRRGDELYRVYYSDHIPTSAAHFDRGIMSRSVKVGEAKSDQVFLDVRDI